MLSNLAKASRLLLPTVFFGYAVAANADLVLEGDWAGLKPSLNGYLHGDMAREVEEVYKTGLPHRAPSIGLLGAMRYKLLGVGKPGMIVGSNEWFFTEEEFAPETNSADRIARSVTEIVRVRDRLAEHGTRLVLVPLPAKSDVYAEQVSGVFDGRAAHDQYSGFVSRLTQAGVRIADTRAVLVDGKARGPVFFKTDTHWTPHGAELVAEAVAGSLEPHEDWEETDFRLAETETVSFWGDLVSFVTDEDYGSLAGLEQERATLWLASAPEEGGLTDLFGAETEFPVVLVGSSYSANPTWSFAEFLKVRLAVDVLNVAEEGVGPGTPMFTYLNGSEFAEQKPKLVIWEFPTRYIAQDLLWADAPAEDDPAALALKLSSNQMEVVQ
jgi:alginate O-acetyltransferase complex protein AlgJ